MDYNSYYTSQAKNEYLPVFQGATFQRGSGFGDVFRNFFRWIMPIVKKNASPILKNIGKEAINTVTKIANDTIEGKNISESASERVNESLKNFQNIYGGKMKNFGYKRKKIKQNNSSKRILDIFDNHQISKKRKQ